MGSALSSGSALNTCWRYLVTLSVPGLVHWWSWSWPWLASWASQQVLRLASWLWPHRVLGYLDHKPSPTRLTQQPPPDQPWLNPSQEYLKYPGKGWGVKWVGGDRYTLMEMVLSGGMWLLPWSFSLRCWAKAKFSSCHMEICCEEVVTKDKNSNISLGKGLETEGKKYWVIGEKGRWVDQINILNVYISSQEAWRQIRRAGNLATWSRKRLNTHSIYFVEKLTWFTCQ